ncbi:MAG: phosphosulfolactate synthase [Sphingobacteriia bacterium]|nr:phosphosulfolactate synthase [Sphingobacteriia bacterium]
MNFELKQVPHRSAKPRSAGVTMAMDKGLSAREAEDFISVAGAYTDLIKLGWATSYVTGDLDRKIAVYQQAGIPFYFGGTLFEAFLIRNQLDDYKRLMEKHKVGFVEISDGSIDMEEKDKLKYIREFAQNFTVLSEVGSKDANKVLAPYQWVEKMKQELEAGAWKVITEAREGGNVGVFQSSGEVKGGLIEEILHNIPKEKILWEAPKKEQQVFFIKALGNEVNLGNISPNEVIPLETLRLGLRGDTFHLFL